MSVQAMVWAMGRSVGSTGAKFVLVALANYADENGECWPSQKQLAADTDQSERSVRTHLAKLEAAGFIRRSERERQRGEFASARYTLCMGSDDELPQADSTGGKICRRQATSLPTAKFAAEPVREPSDKNTPLLYSPHEGTSSSRRRKREDDPRVIDLEWAQVRREYPKRNGSQDWATAEQQFRRRRAEGEPFDVILEGTKRFRAWADATGKTGTEFVMQARRFFGRGKHYREEWEPPAPQLDDEDVWLEELRRGLR